MEFVELFPRCLYSIRYDDQDLDEYSRLFDEWHDPVFLGTFFTENQELLKNEIWAKTPDPLSASMQVIHEANHLSDLINQLNINTSQHKKPDLDDHFKYLDGKYNNIYEYVPMKSYGTDTPSLLRLYAIKMTDRCYLITGGGIKLAKTIQESPGLKDHVIQNIDRVRRFLKTNGIIDSDDMCEN